MQDPKFPDDPSKQFVVPEDVEKPVYAEATVVPGQPGMVFSPYNNKLINVEGIPAGRLVADPTFPASEKKYFKVPRGSGQAGQYPRRGRVS